jgi:hypothetical protein
MHLLERGGPVRKKLYALLTAHEIENGLGKGQGEGIPFPPLDDRPWRWGEGARDGQPPSVKIETNHTARGPDIWGHEPCHDPGTAGHIEDTLTGLRGGQGHEVCRPGTEHGRDQIALVHCIRVSTKLPRLV